MVQKVETTPRWIGQLIDGEKLVVEQKVISELSSKIVVIKGDSAIAVFEAYNKLRACDIDIVGTSRSKKLEVKEILYVGPDGSEFSTVLRLRSALSA